MSSSAAAIEAWATRALSDNGSQPETVTAEPIGILPDGTTRYRVTVIIVPPAEVAP
jgi:hypothetical protein